MDGLAGAVLGGVLIGVAAGLVLLVHGRVAGVSGTVSSVLQPRHPERSWRAAFLLGLLAGGLLLGRFVTDAVPQGPIAPLGLTIVVGLLVGAGARLGGGCTSGHGVCGTALGRVPSIAATLTFLAAGIVIVFLMRHVIGVAS